MNKLICEKTGKGIWMTREVMDKLKTRKLLKASLQATAIPTDSNASGSYKIRFDKGSHLYARYFGNNQWGFMEIYHGIFDNRNIPTAKWSEHPLAKGELNGYYSKQNI